MHRRAEGEQTQNSAQLQREAAVWTKGETAIIDGATYYVTYAFAAADMLLVTEEGTLPEYLSLKLIKIAAISSITPLGDLRPVMEQEAPSSEEPAAGGKERSMNNLKQLAVAMMLYASDYDEYTPYVQKTDTMWVVLPPYFKDPAVMKSPRPDSPYRFNINAGGVNLVDVKAPATTPLFWDPKPWPDGTRLVCFFDGHVESVDEGDWPKVEAALKMKLPHRNGMMPLPPDYKGPME